MPGRQARLMNHGELPREQQRREQRREIAVDLVGEPGQRCPDDAAEEQVDRADREQRALGQRRQPPARLPVRPEQPRLRGRRASGGRCGHAARDLRWSRRSGMAGRGVRPRWGSLVILSRRGRRPRRGTGQVAAGATPADVAAIRSMTASANSRVGIAAEGVSHPATVTSPRGSRPPSARPAGCSPRWRSIITPLSISTVRFALSGRRTSARCRGPARRPRTPARCSRWSATPSPPAVRRRGR